MQSMELPIHDSTSCRSAQVSRQNGYEALGVTSERTSRTSRLFYSAVALCTVLLIAFTASVFRDFPGNSDAVKAKKEQGYQGLQEVYFETQQFDCAAGYQNWQKGWSQAKKTYCCENFGHGCTASEPFDCTAGLSNWHVGWSTAKKQYCCKHTGDGCAEMAPYDCTADLSSWQYSWPRAKKLYCCQHTGHGCAVDEISQFDCQAGFGNWQEGWSDAKKVYCCEHAQMGCRVDEYDCDGGLDDWKQSWPEAKKAYCCQNAGLACPGDEYDCYAGLSSWKAGWSQAKKSYCCMQEDLGCPDALYDCDAGYSNWQHGWSESKKVYCCKQIGRACPNYNCSEGWSNWMEAWDEAQQEWCCEHERKGCPVVSETTTSPIPVEPTTTSSNSSAEPTTNTPSNATLNTNQTAAPTTDASSSTAALTNQSGEPPTGTANSTATPITNQSAEPTANTHSNATSTTNASAEPTTDASSNATLNTDQTAEPTTDASSSTAALTNQSGEPPTGTANSTATSITNQSVEPTANTHSNATSTTNASAEPTTDASSNATLNTDQTAEPTTGAPSSTAAPTNQGIDPPTDIATSTAAPTSLSFEPSTTTQSGEPATAGATAATTAAATEQSHNLNASATSSHNLNASTADATNAVQPTTDESLDTTAETLASTTTVDLVELLHGPTLPPPTFCHENDTMYEPMDMNYSMAGNHADNVTVCQLRCRQIQACGFFSFYEALKICHLALPTATKNTGRTGFKGGPASCDGAQQGATGYTAEIEYMKDSCLLNNLSFYPLASRGRPATTAENPVECQVQCRNTSWCAHFVYNTLTKSCDLQDANSTGTLPAVYQIAGPPDCRPTVMFNAVIDGHGANDMMDNASMVSQFVDLTKSAIVMYIGTYVPYTNGVAGEPEQLLTADDIHVELNRTVHDHMLDVEFGLTLETPKALYARSLFNHSTVSDEIDDQIETFLRTNVAQKLGLNVSQADSVFSVRLSLTNVTDVRLVDTADSWATEQMALFNKGISA